MHVYGISDGYCCAVKGLQCVRIKDSKGFFMFLFYYLPWLYIL
ncbi:hypothetical protein HMPREF9999_02072 [Alloprevotella sp. oral taxon 473 str. F0040]|nr:hypothetical protein HMPREF9999_02072 [Alloprevotella sp. oral taxon 473 str. F0040]